MKLLCLAQLLHLAHAAQPTLRRRGLIAAAPLTLLRPAHAAERYIEQKVAAELGADGQPVAHLVVVADLARVVQHKVARLPLELVLRRGRLLLTVDLGEGEAPREQLEAEPRKVRVVVVVVRVHALVAVKVRRRRALREAIPLAAGRVVHAPHLLRQLLQEDPCPFVQLQQQGQHHTCQLLLTSMLL